MNGLAIFAFVIMPMIAVAMAFVADRLHEASMKRYLNDNHSEG